MSGIYDAFLENLLAGDKEKCVRLALDELSGGNIDIVTLYEKVLAPSLNGIECHNDPNRLCIWKEHVRSAIIRTVIECCYPHVIKERDKRNAGAIPGKIAVVCPDGEYHELGARMAVDFYTLCGYETLYIGSSTPLNEFLDVVGHFDPSNVAISVSNYYNLVSAKKTINAIRKYVPHPLTIIAGGRVFDENCGRCADIGADMVINTYADIVKLSRKGDAT